MYIYVCIYNAHMVQEYGAIGMLETREGFRRKGLAKLLLSSLADHMQNAYIAGSRPGDF